MPPLTLDYGTTPPNQKSVLVWILRSVLAIVLLLFLSWFIVWFFDLRPRDTDGLVDAYRLAPMLADYQKQHGVLPNSKGAIKFRSRFEWKYTNQPKTELQIIAFTRSGYDYRRIVYIDTAFEIHGVGGNWLKENIKDIEAEARRSIDMPISPTHLMSRQTTTFSLKGCFCQPGPKACGC